MTGLGIGCLERNIHTIKLYEKYISIPQILSTKITSIPLVKTPGRIQYFMLGIASFGIWSGMEFV